VNPTIVVAILGLVGTIGGALGGVLITQWRSDARERAAWERETQRERERWGREDEARTFEERRDAYIAFYDILNQTLGRINLQFHPPPHEPTPFPQGWDYPMFATLHRVEIYGSESLVAAAKHAVEVIAAWGNSVHPDPDEPGAIVHDEELSYEAGGSQMTWIAAVRTELGVPKGVVPARHYSDL
jgi:hypothetical protein